MCNILCDIHCAYSDKQEGKISQSEFDQTVGKRIVTGTLMWQDLLQEHLLAKLLFLCRLWEDL